MEFQYKDQQFQIDAVKALTSVFEGQPKQANISYSVDKGVEDEDNITLDILEGFKNFPISLSDYDLLNNIKKVQKENGLLQDSKLKKFL